MTRDDLIRKLIEEMMDSGSAAEQVCGGHPELLSEVRRRWRWMHAVNKDLDALFPTRAARRAFHRSPLTDAPQIPGYEEIAFVGRGGMGVVYRARHIVLGRIVAIKMLLPGMHDAPEETDALLREASAVAALQHPNIVQVFDFGTFDGRPYFTMEFLDGGSLAQRMGGVPQPPREAAELTALLASAVQVAHDGGIVHRDLKPGNILFTADGAARIADFSLARRIAGDPSATLGQLGFGTPSYMAPEQALGAAGRNDPSVDVYALGAVLYDLLTGRAPFRADTPAETHRQVIEEDPAPPSRLNARVPRDLETICLACLRKDPGRRYSSARALAGDLRRFLRGEPVAARPVGPAERLRKWVRRHPTRAAMWLSAGVVFAATLGTVLWTASQRAAIERAVTSDFAEVVRLEEASDWRAARNMLERAKTRIGAGVGRGHLERRAAGIERELNLVDRLGAMRFERAASRDLEFDRAKWWRMYSDAFTEAGLLSGGDTPAELAARVARSSARTALIGAMDDWAICATNEDDLQWLLSATRLADPDPEWRDRARDIAVWKDPAALAALAREAPVEREQAPLLLTVAGRLLAFGSDEAVPLLRRVQAAHPSDFWTSFALGESLNATGDPDAIGFYRAAIALRPEAAAAHVNLGIALEAQNRIAEAIGSMQRAVSLDPKSNVAQFNLAIWLFRQQRFEEAAEHAQQAASIDPERPLAHGVLGSTLMRLGRYSEAAGSFRRAIDLLPEGSDQRASFARALSKCEEAAAAPDAAGGP